MLTIDELIVNANDAFKRLNIVIESELFLSGRYKPKFGEIAVYDQAQAEKFICSQDLEPPYQYWIEILEEHMTLRGEIWNALPDNGKLLGEELGRLSLIQVQSIDKKAAKNALPFILSGAPSESFYGFLVDLTFDGHLNSFRENQLRIYREGGQPCGWRGEYPEGELLVFVREQK
jgi:hypothetical protein